MKKIVLAAIAAISSTHALAGVVIVPRVPVIVRPPVIARPAPVMPKPAAPAPKPVAPSPKPMVPTDPPPVRSNEMMKQPATTPMPIIFAPHVAPTAATMASSPEKRQKK